MTRHNIKISPYWMYKLTDTNCSSFYDVGLLACSREFAEMQRGLWPVG
jgi:hypothetical protein